MTIILTLLSFKASFINEYKSTREHSVYNGKVVPFFQAAPAEMMISPGPIEISNQEVILKLSTI